MSKDLKKQIEDLKNKKIEDDEELEVPTPPKKINVAKQKLKDAKKSEDPEKETLALVEEEARVLRDSGLAAYYTIIHLQNISSKLDKVNENLINLCSKFEEDEEKE